MHDVIDCINATTSPEELAINFLMRHARCRMELSGRASESLLNYLFDSSRLDTPTSEQEASGWPGFGDGAADSSRELVGACGSHAGCR
ncbi:MAG: hypothetical protein ABI129_07550 [Rhodanobacter sp.]